MKRKYTLIAAVAALGALLATGTTLAWFTGTKTVTNVVTVGNVRIQIDETSTDPDAILGDRGISWTGAVTPGQVLSKVPVVKNIGRNTAWVRAYAEFGYEKDGKAMELPAGVEAPVIDYNTGSGEKQWTFRDGRYYCNGPLTAEDVTGELFSHVTIPPSWNNQEGTDMSDVKVEIIVHGAAIQYDNNNAGGVFQAFDGFGSEDSVRPSGSAS